jgi:hypothetical protein
MTYQILESTGHEAIASAVDTELHIWGYVATDRGSGGAEELQVNKGHTRGYPISLTPSGFYFCDMTKEWVHKMWVFCTVKIIVSDTRYSKSLQQRAVSNQQFYWRGQRQALVRKGTLLGFCILWSKLKWTWKRFKHSWTMLDWAGLGCLITHREHFTEQSQTFTSQYSRRQKIIIVYQSGL